MKVEVIDENGRALSFLATTPDVGHGARGGGDLYACQWLLEKLRLLERHNLVHFTSAPVLVDRPASAEHLK